jgi:hypothetical protein
MTIAVVRRSTLWLIAVLFTALAGCVAVGGYDGGYYGGYDGGATASYGVGFYEPFGYDYGGWQPGYRVGPPPRGGYDHPARTDSHQSQPTYHPAPPSRSVPSIPVQSRGGQSHGGQSSGGQPSGGGRSGH